MSRPIQRRNGVLVVDDDADVRLFFRIILEDHGYTVYEAEDGKKALDVLDNQAKEDIFCVITDYLMPRVNGVQLCNQLRNDDKYKFIACILLISAYLDDPRLSDFSCFNARFSKPVNHDKLVSIVSSFCPA